MARRGAALLAGVGAAAGVRIAWVGNSYTFCDGTGGNKGYYNDLPAVLQSVAKAGGIDVEYSKVTPGQSSIFDHANMSYHCDCLHWADKRHCDQWKSCGEETQEMLQDSKGWDYVVVQDNSQIPGESDGNDHGVKRTIKSLKTFYAPLIDAAGAQGVMYETWGYRDGDLGWDPTYTDFPSMNNQTIGGYEKYAAALTSATTSGKEAIVVPCAKAWQLAYDLTGADTSEFSRFSCMYSCGAPRGQYWTPPCYPDWWGQGGHPGPFGTYLNALVFYGKLFQKSPVGLQWAPKGVSDEMRDWAQLMAEWAVSGTKPAPLPPPAPPATPSPPCICGDDYPHCWNEGDGHDNYCYKDWGSRHAQASDTECPAHCSRSAGPAPPPPGPPAPKKPCTCGADYPYCSNYYGKGDFYCHKDKYSKETSDTECPGKCTKSYVPPPPPPCQCGADYPYCWSQDHYCYKDSKSDDKSSDECPGKCTQSYVPPPPPPPAPCQCGSDYPYCWSDGQGADHYCYKSEDSYDKSSTECPGTCTSSH